MRVNKYFEVKSDSEFYYALIKADNKEEAIDYYNELVSNVITQEERDDLSDDMKELSFSEVISNMRIFSKSESQPVSDTDILDMLIDKEVVLLAVDRGLL